MESGSTLHQNTQQGAVHDQYPEQVVPGHYTTISAAETRLRGSCAALRPGKSATQVPLRVYVDGKPYGDLDSKFI